MPPIRFRQIIAQEIVYAFDIAFGTRGGVHARPKQAIPHPVLQSCQNRLDPIIMDISASVLTD